MTDRIVVLGAAVFGAFIINENAGQVVVPGTNIESIGMLVFVLCLGYVVLRTVFRSQADFAVYSVSSKRRGGFKRRCCHVSSHGCPASTSPSGSWQ
ncbi:MAG TPA: hypothetical protein VNZ24_12180 [Vicinamibacterales bacterium]|nr:hypothetical protein [Vicinamibacterales bacterium]